MSSKTKTIMILSALVSCVIVCLCFAFPRSRPPSDTRSGKEWFLEKYAELMEIEEWLTSVEYDLRRQYKKEWSSGKWPAQNEFFTVLYVPQGRRSSAVEKLSDVSFVELFAEDVKSLAPSATEAMFEGRKAYLVRCLEGFWSGDTRFRYNEDRMTFYAIADLHGPGMSFERTPIILFLDSTKRLEKVELWVFALVEEEECCGRK